MSEKVKAQDETIKGQSEKIKSLEEKINLLVNGRKSHTSSTPPSHDIGRSNKKNLRTKSNRKSGGQPGHKGHNLEMKVTPDEVKDYIPEFCDACKSDLRNESSVVNDRRQEIIIPPVIIHYLEHRTHSRTCSCCGVTSTAQFPDHIKAPIQYGTGIADIVSYLSVYQYIPYKRMVAMFKDLFNLPISEGTIDNMLARSAQKAKPAYTALQVQIQESEVVGADETGSSINGKKGWFHTWQNEMVTFIVASLNRGYDTIKTYFPDGFPSTIYVSDCWAAQLKTLAFLHQLCLVHLLRELTNFADALSCDWSKEMKQLFQDAIVLKHQLNESDYDQTQPAVLLLETRLDELLAMDYSKRHRKIKAFTKRLIKNRQSIFTFLYYSNVPHHNNGAERAIRTIKVKTKVSGQFKCEEGANRFAVLRSIIDTAIKNSKNIFEELANLAQLSPT